MTEELKDKELSDINYLRARMTGNVGLALDHAYNLGFFEGEKNVAEKILNYLNSREKVSDDEWLSFEIKDMKPADVAPVIHAKWKDGSCSNCHCDVPAYIIDWKWVKDMDAKYCPNCGAKMDKE